jgi:hypothetical protein
MELQPQTKFVIGALSQAEDGRFIARMFKRSLSHIQEEKSDKHDGTSVWFADYINRAVEAVYDGFAYGEAQAGAAGIPAA